MHSKAIFSRTISMGCVFCILCVLLQACVTSRESGYFEHATTRANVYVTPQFPDVARLAVMPFRASTELIGISVSDMFVTEVLRLNRYELVERTQMARVLGEKELAMAGLSAASAVAAGQMLGADAVIIGTVDEYATVAQRGHAFPVVGVSARMIYCPDGKVLWSVDLAERARRKGITLPEHARAVIHQMMAAVYKAMK